MIAALGAIGGSLREAFFMLWETLWALVLGFGLSGAVQAFVSRTEMRNALGDHRPGSLARSSFFGVISSSCSYASSALAKSLFSRGADFTAAMVFMVASTNLVVELGIVLWLLIGWEFALAEFVGGTIMIVLLGLVLPRVIPASWIAGARERLAAQEDPVREEVGTEGTDAQHEHDAAEPGELTSLPWRRRLASKAGWSDAAGYTISDLTMLRKELVFGFIVAGFLAVLVPTAFWQSLFLTGHGFLSSLENVVLGPPLAIISFVCSVGNVPLAAALWHGGISFGGVISFVFADLLTLPLLLIYRKYYGGAITLRLLGVFWAVMSLGGLATEYLFKLVSIPTPGRPTIVAPTRFEVNYTLVLNVIALLVFGVLYWLYRNRNAFGGGKGYAKDLVCGMQVQISQAPATARHAGQRYWFCSDHCKERFVSDPERYAEASSSEGTAQSR
ncbi:MAG: permease [Sciscionella sp.]